MKVCPVLQGSVCRREEEEFVHVKQPTLIVQTLVQEPRAKIMYDTEAYKWKFDHSVSFPYPSSFWL